MKSLKPGRKFILISVVVGFAFLLLFSFENHNRREAMVPGNWYHVSHAKVVRLVDGGPMIIKKDGTVPDGPLSTTWTYFNGKVTIAPKSSDESVWILSEDGKHLHQEGEFDSEYVKGK